MARGMNVKNIRERNKNLILHLLNDEGDMSRKAISQKTGLTPAAVTKLTAELILEGEIRENGKYETDRSGRKEVYLTLCLEDKTVFGVNAERDSVTYSISDMAGNLKALETRSFSDDIDVIVQNAKAFYDTHGIKADAIGVCVIGSPTLGKYGIWDINELKSKLGAAFDDEIVIENNVRAFAEAELLYGDLHNRKSELLFKWGPGVGSSIVTNGRVFSGDDNSVAEIGHYIIDPDGALCRCKRRGCLETEVSLDAIAAELKGKGVDIDASVIVKSELEEVKQVFDKKAEAVATALINTATILSARDVIVYGSVFERDGVIDKIREVMHKEFGNFKDDMVNISGLNGKRNYIGASAICASALFFRD